MGHWLWLFVPAIKKGRTKDLAALWWDPYTVVDKANQVNYRITLVGYAGNLVVHRNHLKLCYGENKTSGLQIGTEMLLEIGCEHNHRGGRK